MPAFNKTSFKKMITFDLEKETEPAMTKCLFNVPNLERTIETNSSSILKSVWKRMS